MTADYGQRDAAQGSADDLRGRMAMSPTGRQLISDGSFVLSVYESDPADTLIAPANGTLVWWYAADTDTLKQCGFTRASGWRYVVFT